MHGFRVECGLPIFKEKFRPMTIKLLSISLVVVGLTSVSLTALAEEPASNEDTEAEESPWKATAELGFISTTGNTETTSVQAKMDATHELQRWRNQYKFSGLLKEDEVQLADGSTSSERTAERYSVSIKSAYKLEDEYSNLFVFGSHTDDQFGAFETYTSLALGYGARLLHTKTMDLDVEVGPGYFWADRQLDEGGTMSEEGAIFRGALEYNWAITRNADFQQTLSVESGADNTRTISDTSLSTRINGSLQMKVGFNVSADSDVAQDKEKTDTTTYINLVYKF